MMNVEPILVSTRNAHKLEEIGSYLAPLELVGLDAIPELGEVAETGETFVENATLKAVAASQLRSNWVLADDSGLAVEVLDGAPGVYSARFAGEGASDAENNEKLLRELAGEKNRTARFHCLMVLARGGKVVGTFSGEVSGEILEESRGSSGFGYDPLFKPFGYDGTFAELGGEVKNRLSHRAVALAKVKNFLFQQEPSLRR